MKRFLRQLALFALVQVGVAAARGLHLAIDGDNHYLAAFRDKRAGLAGRDSPRIVFVGGSNLAFGLDSLLVQRELGLRPVNTGLHAGLGLELILDLARDRVAEGDVVVVSPEYELFGELPTATLETQLLLHCPETAPLVIRSWRDFVDRDAFGYAGEFTRQGWRWLRHRGRELEEGPYRRKAFNEFGDVVSHCALKGKDLSRRPPLQVAVTVESLEKSIALLNRFHDDCRARGATVYLSFPPVPEDQLAANEAAVRQIESALRSKLAFPILDDARQMTFPPHEFFDTVYHLSAVGRQKRTQRLLGNLSRRMVVDRHAWGAKDQRDARLR